MIEISVIIPTFNRADSLERVLHFLSAQTLDPDRYEVIVVDDGSEDHTSEVVTRADIVNMVSRRQPNQGEIMARKLGVSLARGRLLAFIDDDVFVAPAYLEALVAAHAGESRRIVIGRVYEYFDPALDPTRVMKAHAGPQAGFLTEEVAYVNCSGHSFSISRDGYDQIGGMRPLDQKGRNAWGGIDFAHRAQRLGYRVYRAQMALALHHDCFSKDYRTLVLRWERTSAKAVLLLRRYPDLRGRIPMLRDKHVIDWRSDTPLLVGRKLVKRLVGLKPLTELLDLAAAKGPRQWRHHAEHWGLEGHIVRGYREGLKRYGRDRPEVPSADSEADPDATIQPSANVPSQR